MRRRDAELIGQLRGGEPDADEAATGTKPDPRFDDLRDLRVADEQAADAQLPWGWRPIPDRADRAIIDKVLRLGRVEPTAVGRALGLHRSTVRRRLKRLGAGAQHLTIATRAILSGDDPAPGEFWPFRFDDRRGVVFGYDPEEVAGINDGALEDLQAARERMANTQFWEQLVEMDPDLLVARPVPPSRCDHCGRFISASAGRGRPRQWCRGRRGDRCRKRHLRRRSG